MSDKQHQNRNQEYAEDDCGQQKKLMAEDRLSVLQVFPHIQARRDRAIAECRLDMENHVKSVNEFFDLSPVMLENYLDHPHTINESPCQHIISSKKLENSALRIYM